MNHPGWLLFPDRDVIADLRRMQPHRPLSWPEAKGVSERQALRLLDFFFIKGPPTPELVIACLADLSVDRRTGWPTSGMAIHGGGRHWRIVINADEPPQRQRFSLAHEFKHVLDDPMIDRLHAHLPESERNGRAERLCDYFAACLLMPRVWVKRDWCAGMQRIDDLAHRYYVSPAAMTNRLSDLGIAPPSFGGTHAQRHNKVKEVAL